MNFFRPGNMNFYELFGPVFTVNTKKNQKNMNFYELFRPGNMNFYELFRPGSMNFYELFPA